MFTKFKTESRNYIYDTWTNAILEVDRNIYKLLPEIISDGKKEETTYPEDLAYAISEIKQMRKEGYLKLELPEVETFPEDSLEKAMQSTLSSGPRQVILNITERCNLRCRYCSFSGAYPANRVHSDRSMSWNLAQSALDWYFGHKERNEFNIGLYGGEPFLVFPLIKKIVQYSRKLKGRNCHFSITTNATMLNDEICRFLIDEEFTTTISLDGPQEIHDRYRVDHNEKGSFKQTMEGIQRLYNLDPEGYSKRVVYSMVLAPPLDMIAIQQFIEKNQKFFQGIPILAVSVNPHPSNVKTQLNNKLPEVSENQQLFQLYKTFKKQLIEEKQASGLAGAYYSKEFIKIHQRSMSPMNTKTVSHGQCVPGVRKVFINTDGDMYMCERVSPILPIGKIPGGVNPKLVTDFLKNYSQFFKERCRDCWAIRLCDKCFNNIRIGGEFSETRTRQMCKSRLTGIQQLLTAYCDIRETKDDAFECMENVELI